MEDFDVGLPPDILSEDDKAPQDESDVELPPSVGDESGLDLPSPVASSGEQDHSTCACNRKCQTRIDVEVVEAIQKEQRPSTSLEFDAIAITSLTFWYVYQENSDEV